MLCFIYATHITLCSLLPDKRYWKTADDGVINKSNIVVKVPIFYNL